MAASDSKATAYWGVAHRVTFPIFDGSGSLVSGASSPDSEISKDGGTFADCTNEATEIATSSGMYYLDLTATEMEADQITVIVKSGNGKTVPIVIYPEPGIRTRKAQGGAATSLTLDASAVATDDFYNGCLVSIVGGTGVGQTRLVVDYVGSTKVATVAPDWVTNPDSTSIFHLQRTHELAILYASLAVLLESQAAKKSLYTAIAKAVHKTEDAAGTLNIYRSDGSTVHATQTIGTDAANLPLDSLTGAA